MAQIIEFPKSKKALQSEQAHSAPGPHGEIAIAAGERPMLAASPQEAEIHKIEAPKPPVYVRIRADIFREFLETMQFYALQGFDHGNKAKELMSKVYAKEPA